MALRDGALAKRGMATAALELFTERGYDAVSAAEIAARAGVTERTFFRHFPSKREVLFDGEAVLRDALLEAIAAVPPDTAPLDILLSSFHAITPLLEANRSFAEPRQVLIERTPILAERELAKIAALTETLAQALCARGDGDLIAAMASQAAMGVFTYATVAWLSDPQVTLKDRLLETESALRGLTTRS